MADEALVLDRAVAQLLAAERHVAAHAKEYADRDDLTATQLLLRTLQMVIEDALREVLDIQRELDAPPPPSVVERGRYLAKVRSTARRTAALVGQPLYYIARPHGRDFDPIAVAYARMARQIEPNTEIIFRGSERGSYALSAPLLGSLRDNLVNRGSSFVRQLDQLPTILFVQYPATAEGDVLQHLLLAHEVAHLALRRPRPGGHRTEGEARFDDAMEVHRAAHPEWHAVTVEGEEQAEGAREGQPDVGHELQPPNVDRGDLIERRRQRDRARRWFVEIACDLLAVRLVGPAYLVALSEHALVRQWFYASNDTDAETHPHLAWRLTRARSQMAYFLTAMPPASRATLADTLDPYLQLVPDPAEAISEEGHWGHIIEAALDDLTDTLNDTPSNLLGEAAFPQRS